MFTMDLIKLSKLKINQKIIFPSIKLVSLSLILRGFLSMNPLKIKINITFENSYPLDKDVILVFPEGITNIGEINHLENNFGNISNQLTDKSKIILGITSDDGEKIFNSWAVFNKEFEIEDKYNKNACPIWRIST